MTHGERVAVVQAAITRTRKARVAAAAPTTGHEAERAYATAAICALADAGQLVSTLTTGLDSVRPA